MGLTESLYGTAWSNNVVNLNFTEFRLPQSIMTAVLHIQPCIVQAGVYIDRSMYYTSCGSL
jgi:hypothetical protein